MGSWQYVILLMSSIKIFNLTKFTKTEDALSHYNLKKDIQDAKHWLVYINKSLEITAMHTLNRTKILTCSFNQMRMKYYNFCRFVNITSYARFECKPQPETKTAPIILLIISWFEDSCYSYKRTYKLIFELNLQFTLNITFNKLITRDYFGTCNLYHLTVAFGTCGDKYFKYCGMLSHFSVFPPSRNVSFYVQLQFRQPVFIDVMFHVISAQLIESHKTEKFSFTMMFAYFVPPASRLITNFRILVNKHERLTLYSGKVSRKINVIIFDGPGFFSGKRFVQKETVNISIATFQCVVQIIYHEHKKEQNISAFISYLTSTLSAKNKYVNVENIWFPDDSCL